MSRDTQSVSKNRAMFPFLVALWLLAISGRGTHNGRVSAEVQRRLGKPLVSILQGATRVDAFRVDSRPFEDLSHGFCGRPILSLGQSHSPEFLQELLSELHDSFKQS